MRIKALFTAVVLGLAALSGICKGLSGPRGAKVAEKEKKREIGWAGETQEKEEGFPSATNAEL